MALLAACVSIVVHVAWARPALVRRICPKARALLRLAVDPPLKPSLPGRFRSLVYFVSLIALCLGLTVLAVDARRGG